MKLQISYFIISTVRWLFYISLPSLHTVTDFLVYSSK